MNFSIKRLILAVYDRLWRGPQGYGRPVGAAIWDRDYASGKWSFLDDMTEIARYSIIHSYASKLKVPASILDIGCGPGILRSLFSNEDVIRYTGIDLSVEAVRMAVETRFFASEFLVADFDHYKSDDNYDIIIFNESIYYAIDPGKTFAKYWSLLRPGGACIVSIHDYDMRSRATWRRITRHAVPKFANRLVNEKGQAWDVKLFLKL